MCRTNISYNPSEYTTHTTVYLYLRYMSLQLRGRSTLNVRNNKQRYIFSPPQRLDIRSATQRNDQQAVAITVPPYLILCRRGNKKKLYTQKGNSQWKTMITAPMRCTTTSLNQKHTYNHNWNLIIRNPFQNGASWKLYILISVSTRKSITSHQVIIQESWIIHIKSVTRWRKVYRIKSKFNNK